jgi:flavodoxin
MMLLIRIKKISLFLICLLVPVLAWAQDIQDSARVLVVYYSRTNHTHSVAQKLAARFNGDLERLIDKRKRTGPIGYSRAGRDAIAGNLTEIQPLTYNPQDYDIILIGTPTWASHIAPAVRTFIAQNDLSGKTIGLFGVCHFSGVKEALNEAAKLISLRRGKNFATLPLKESQLKDETLNPAIDQFYLEVYESR